MGESPDKVEQSCEAEDMEERERSPLPEVAESSARAERGARPEADEAETEHELSEDSGVASLTERAPTRAESGVATEPEDDVEPEAAPEPEAGTESEAEPGSEPESEVEVEPEAEVGSESGPEAEPELEPEAEVAPGPEAEPAERGDSWFTRSADAASGSESEAEPATRGGSWFSRGSEADADDVAAEAEPEVEPELQPAGQGQGQGGSWFTRSADTPTAALRPAALRQQAAPPTAVAVVESDPTPETTAEALEILSTFSSRPMTPLRRAGQRIRLWGGLLAVLLAIFAVVQVLRPLPKPQLQMTAASEYTFPGSKPVLAWPSAGQSAVEVEGLGVLGHSGGDDPVPIASVTKVMTAALILKDHPLAVGEQGPTITVDQQAVTEYNTELGTQSLMKVSVGEKLSEYQALQMMLIPSANNVARLLGRWDSGTDAAFLAKMNAEAAALGMTKTTYTDPSGFEDTTKSTANDQLKLASVVMADPVFREIVGTAAFNPPENPKTYNTNSLIGQNGVIGIKTGSDSAAGGCLMWAAETKATGSTQLILGVVLGQQAQSQTVGILQVVLENSRKLVVSAESQVLTDGLVQQGEVVGYVDDGEGGRTPVVASRKAYVTGWSGMTLPVELQTVSGGVPHSAKAGTVVGDLVIGTGSSAQKIPVTVQSDLVAPSYGTRLLHI